MSFFKSLEPLLADCNELKCTIKLHGGQIKVIVHPTAPANGKTIEPKLLAPLPLLGTADELDEGFAGVVATYRSARKSLAEQAEATESILKSAEKDQLKKASAQPASKKALPPVTADASLKGNDDDEGAGDEGIDNDTEGSVSIPATDTSPTKPTESAINDLSALLL